MNVSVLFPDKLKDISDDLLMESGKLKLLPYKEYDKYAPDDLRYFCHKNARYGIPTVELIDFLKYSIHGRFAIEIGAGHGDLGYHLGIPMTDNKQQFWPEIRKFYGEIKQPTIDYPDDDVEELDGLEAVKKYNPQVVIGSWITTYSPYEASYPSSPTGLKEDEIFDRIETLILIGNLSIHGNKPILKNKHKIIKEPFIISRSQNPSDNCIIILNNDRNSSN